MFERIISKLSLNARATTAEVMQKVRESKRFNDEAAKTFLVFFFFYETARNWDASRFHHLRLSEGQFP